MFRKFLLICMCLVVAANLYCQNDTTFLRDKYYGFAAGLGVSVVSATDIVDYINLSYNPPQKLDDFGAAAEFFGNINYQISPEWGLKVEYAYLLKSYDVPAVPYLPDFNFSYGIHMPTLVAQYFVLGKGYVLKFGGGMGYHFASLTSQTNITTTVYRAHGVGLKLDAEGDTAFDDHLFSYIGVDIRDDLLGELESSDGQVLALPSKNRNAKMNFMSVGLKFGLSYYF